jgi:hypothetical protein
VIITLSVTYLITRIIVLIPPNDEKVCEKFDAFLFGKETQCTDDDLNLFVDIANYNLVRRKREINRFIKWESDIKVEIADKEKLSKEQISDVDSMIAIVRPLIKPVKICRVEKNGNFRIHRNVEESRYATTTGYTFTNNYFWGYKLTSVDVYEKKGHHERTLFHEFLHGLGLAHPRKEYPYNLIMEPYGHRFETVEEYLEYSDQKFPVTEQEKQVLRMLYSPTIKSGLKIECFKKKMNMK